MVISVETGDQECEKLVLTARTLTEKKLTPHMRSKHLNQET